MLKNTMHDALRSVSHHTSGFVGLIRAYPAIWIGFACICAWPWSCTSATLIYENTTAVGSPVWLSSNFTYLMIGAVGFTIAYVSKRGHYKLRSSTLALIAGISYAAASVLFVQLCKLPADSYDAGYRTIAFLWPLFAGIGQGFLFVEWIKVFGQFEPRKAIAFFVGAAMFGATVLLLMNFIPQGIREFAPLMLGIGASMCTLVASRQLMSSVEKKGSAPLEVKQSRPPWKLLVTSAVAGFAFGIFQSFSFSGLFGQAAWYTFGVLGFLGAALLFAFVALALRMNFNYMIYRFTFIVMALGCLISLLDPAFAAWGYSIFCVGYRCFDMLSWCLCAYLVYHRGVNPAWLAGLWVGALLFGRFIGFEFFTVLYSGSYQFHSSLIVIVMFALLVTAVSLVSHNNLLEAWGMDRPGSIRREDEITEVCCTRIGDEYGLSSRELDVLIPLALGSSRGDIGRELVLSEETVKTHIKHIYQKLGIHSRKELHAIIEAKRRELQEDNMSLAKNSSRE